MQAQALRITVTIMAIMIPGCATSPKILSPKISCPTSLGPKSSLPPTLGESLDGQQPPERLASEPNPSDLEQQPSPPSPVTFVSFQESDAEVDGEQPFEVVPAELGELQAQLEQLAPMQLIPNEEDSGVTLDTLIDLALANNPALQLAAAAAGKASGIRTQVGLRPNVNIGYSGQEIGNGGNPGQHGAFFSQTYVGGRKLQWNRQVAGHDLNAQRWQIQVQRQRIETDVRIRFYRVLTAQQRLEEAVSFRQAAMTAVDIAAARLDAAEGARPDLLQSQILVDQVDLTIQAVEFEWRAAWQELAAIAGVPELEGVRLSERLNTQFVELDIESLYQQIASQSPLLQAALARVDRTRANLQRQRRQPIPNLYAQAGVAHDNDSGNDIASVQLSLPIPIQNKNEGNIQAASAAYTEALQNVRRIRMQIRFDLANALQRYDTARVRAERFQTSILPKANESLELIQQAQTAGEVEFLRVLTARQSFFEFNQQYLAELGQLAQTRSEIDGLLLTGGLSKVDDYNLDDGLRGQALGNQ